MSSLVLESILADFFKDMGLIEKYGSGIARIIGAIKKEDLPQPHFCNISDGFMVTVFTHKADLKAVLKAVLKASLSQQENQILNYIASNENITQQELSKKMGISQRNIRIHIQKLKDKQLLQRTGGRKMGRWILDINK